MSRLDQLIRQLAPEGVVFRTLGEVGQFVRGNGLQKADLTSSGTPAIHYGQVHTIYGVWTATTRSFTSPELSAKLRKANTGDLIIATTSEDDAAVGKATAWLGEQDVAVSGDAYIYRHQLDPRYVSYFFKSEHFRTQKTPYITGTKVRRISGESLARIQIPVPPLEVQREIVRILDNFTELEAELEARRRQYELYRAQLFDRATQANVRWSTLGEVSSHVSSGATPTARSAQYYRAGTIPWLRTQEVRFTDVWDTEMRITEKALKDTAAKWIPADCVIVAISGATAGRSAVGAACEFVKYPTLGIGVWGNDRLSTRLRADREWASSDAKTLMLLPRTSPNWIGSYIWMRRARNASIYGAI